MTVIINPDPALQNNLMSFGWECDKGWYPIIQELIDRLNNLKSSSRLEDIYVLQIKEKFGTLRFYVSGGNDDSDSLITYYEGLSEHVCEKCGEFYTSRLRVKNHWYKTLCDKCAKELGYEIS